MEIFKNPYLKKFILLALGLLGIQAITLYLFGQPPICMCGTIKLWEGVVTSAGTSQHISDWYTFSHIIHGMLFYGLLHLLFPRMRTLSKLLIAMGIEISWEISENTPWVIEKYREQALARGYVGDSILNSLCDTVAMMIGFVLARKLPVFATVLVAIIFELFVGYMIHDNLTLNILGFIHHFEFIDAWQAAKI